MGNTDKTMCYFGTSLNEYGHFLWELHENQMSNLGISFKQLPFDPERLTNNFQRGQTMYYQSMEFTCIGIAGSCIDERGGTKSIFWVNEKISFSEMKERILNNPIAKKITDKMVFKILW